MNMSFLCGRNLSYKYFFYNFGTISNQHTQYNDGVLNRKMAIKRDLNFTLQNKGTFYLNAYVMDVENVVDVNS